MRIVVTGASGNVGSALLRRLRLDGEHEVVGVARRVPAGVVDGVRWVSVDLAEPGSRGRLCQAFAGADAVVHLAWAFQPSHQVGYLESVGVGGSQRVLQASAVADVAHVVHVSSVGAYSPKRDDRAVDESWPVDGVPTSSYSRHKAAVERLLDGYDGPPVARLRPGIAGQASAGSALLRYGLPVVVPAKMVGALPALPMPAGLTIAMVHADDLADAIVRVLERRAEGAFNLAAPTPVTAPMIAEVLGARWVDTPAGLARGALALSWHARLQPLAPGWFDLACGVPALDSSRAVDELGWSPKTDAVSVLRELVEGMSRAGAGDTAVLRERSVRSELADLFRHGPVSHRVRP
ncbi:NAD-dependent epimerase/dehydratase family protein [Kribbella sp. NPDC051770]|uniref:NAD-dependent epimerase/dehydratase family protein n=1 Tax=Kribbella sp. NPDC051770 TaxID=3155413 RepID=UPI00342C20E6